MVHFDPNIFANPDALPTKFSECHVTDANKTARLMTAIQKKTITPVANAILLDSGTVMQFLCIHKGKTAVLTRPFPATDADLSSVILASLGDDMDAICPVQMPTKYFRGHFVGLIRAATAMEFDWLATDDDPLQLKPPPSLSRNPRILTASIGMARALTTGSCCIVFYYRHYVKMYCLCNTMRLSVKL
jgi:hypothetical protein